VEICVATGRPWVDASDVISALGCTGPAILSSGARALNAPGGTPLWASVLSEEEVGVVTQEFAKHPYDVLCDTDSMTGPRPHRTTQQLRDLAPATLSLMDVPYTLGCTVARRLRDHTNVEVTVGTSWAPGLFNVDVTTHGVSKASAARAVLQLLAVDKCQAAAVGDGENDVALFAAVGFRVAMKNAVPSLLSIANRVVPSVHEDGLSEYLDSLQ
jgi:hydroxymethylpyrimidine pyrophosphatase-like HAD family hydrolase